MKCESARRIISDATDKAIAFRKIIKLQRHLACCPDCRSYKKLINLIQARAGQFNEPLFEQVYWQGLEERIIKRLETETSGRFEKRSLFFGRPWLKPVLAAGMVVSIVIGLIFFRLSKRSHEDNAVMLTDVPELMSTMMSTEAFPDFIESFANEIQTYLDETVDFQRDIEDFYFAGQDPLFWESLTEEELSRIVAEFQEDNGQGGPK